MDEYDEDVDLTCLPKPIKIPKLPYGPIKVSAASAEFVKRARGRVLTFSAGELEPD